MEFFYFRALKQQKEEERARREAERLAEEKALRAERERKLEEERKRREEERLKKEAERRAREEERQRKEEEKRRKVVTAGFESRSRRMCRLHPYGGSLLSVNSSAPRLDRTRFVRLFLRVGNFEAY